jgi:hypothetical protein
MNDLGKDPNWGRTVDYHLREVWQAKNKDGKNYEGELTSVYRCNNCDGPMNTNNQYITQISFRETAPQKSTSSSNLGMLFYDHFDDKVYLDKWTVLNQTPLTTITESGSDLHLYSKKPSGKDPQNAILMAKPFFSSHAFAVETRIKPLGRGGMWMMIFKDWNNYLRFGFSTDDTPYIEIDGMRNGKWFAESKCCSHALFNASYHTFTIKKSGSQYQVFIDGNAWGRYVHDSIGDSNLRIGLWSETFEWKSRDADNYIDYIKVEE